MKQVKSPLRYPGGKNKSAALIAQHFPPSFKEYREPFCGGASLFFYTKQNFPQCKDYWINDSYSLLMDFWLTAQKPVACQYLMEDLEELRQGILLPPGIQELFKHYKNNHSGDAFDRAKAFFFINRVSFSGTSEQGGLSPGAKRFTASSIERLKPMPEMLKDVTISCMDYKEVLAASGDEVFIFLDPPYTVADMSNLYKEGGFDHIRLRESLTMLRHKWLMTYDDHPTIRELYKGFNIKPLELQYSMVNCGKDKTSRKGKELLISNY